MGEQFQTIKARLASAIPTSARHDAILVFIYPTGPGMGTRFPLRETPVMIGRGDPCDVKLQDDSVSRRHAIITPVSDGYSIRDLDSTNGTFLNNIAVKDARLRDGDYVKVGNAIYRFLMSGNVEAEYHEEIYRLAIIDALTGIHNKRYFLEFLDREFSRAVRYERPLALVLFDIDHFKRINDTRSHLAGDAVLRDLAGTVKEGIRKEELFARYGGEEFALVLPETTPDHAAAVAERVRASIENHQFIYEGESFRVTVSLGVACTRGELASSTELVQRADEALYQAKREDRNCVRVYQG